MSWIHFLAAGACFGVYTVGTMIKMAQQHREGKLVAQLDTAESPDKPQEDTKGAPELRAREDGMAETPIESVNACEVQVVAGAGKCIAAAGQPADDARQCLDSSTMSDLTGTAPGPGYASHAGKKMWFLVQSSTGQVRVCRALGPTPKTVAGPFTSKEAAQQAKRI